MPVPHWSVHASLSEPVFWSNGSGGRSPNHKTPTRTRMRGRSESSPDPDPKKQEGGRNIDDETHPRLCSGPGPAAGGRDANENDGKVRGWRLSGGWKRSAGGCVYVYVSRRMQGQREGEERARSSRFRVRRYLLRQVQARRMFISIPSVTSIILRILSHHTYPRRPCLLRYLSLYRCQSYAAKGCVDGSGT